MVIGLYVGIATVGGATYWFLYDPTGPQVNYYQLSNFLQCPAEPENFKATVRLYSGCVAKNLMNYIVASRLTSVG